MSFMGINRMNYVVKNVPLWTVTTWDKKYNAVDRSWQPNTIKYSYLLNDELDRINTGEGNVRLLYTGKDIGFTTEALAGKNLCEGEIVSIPWGGTPSVKYYKGKFVTGDNRIATSNDPSKLSNKYLYYYLRGHISEVASYYRGAGLKHPSMKDVLKMRISYPSLEDQKAICAQFDRIEDIVNLRSKELSLIDDLIKARFAEMFGDPILNPKGFPVYRMDEVVEFQGGSQPDKKYFEYVPTKDNIRLIQIRDYKTDNYITYIPKSMAKRFCAADDIMIGRYGPPIFQILQGIEGSFNVALMKAIPLMGNKEFIRYFLKQDCLLHYLEGMSKRTAGQDGIQMDKLKAYPFPMPPIEAQESFTAFVAQVDKSKDAIQKSLETTQLLFDSLMQKYFGQE